MKTNNQILLASHLRLHSDAGSLAPIHFSPVKLRLAAREEVELQRGGLAARYSMSAVCPGERQYSGGQAIGLV